MKKGTFCISLDTELLWGRWDLNYQPFKNRAAKVRPIINQLLTILDTHNIPATWAIVGNLYLTPTSREKETKLWRAPDIIQEIKKHKNQEIACHSLSHCEFTRLVPSEANTDLTQCVKLAQKQNIKLKSFVFPRNKIAHLNLLQKHGFTCYRSANQYTSPALQLIDLILPLPDKRRPAIHSSLLALPGNFYFLSCRGPRKYLPISLRVRRAKLGIDQAIKHQGLFHLWFHPIDLADNSQAMLQGIDKICQYASLKLKQNLLQIKTMSQITQEAKN